MKKFMILCSFLLATQFLIAQSSNEQTQVSKACMNYIEGFYEGDVDKLKACLTPSLLKFGYWKNSSAEGYKSQGQMTYEKALAYAKNVKEKQKFADKDAPKGVEVLDVMDHIAAAKVTAWWGVDYILLAKNDGKWMIEQILWQGPLKK